MVYSALRNEEEQKVGFMDEIDARWKRLKGLSFEELSDLAKSGDNAAFREMEQRQRNATRDRAMCRADRYNSMSTDALLREFLLKELERD